MVQAKTSPPLAPPPCLADAKIAILPAGSKIFSPGDVCENFYFLLFGRVRVDLVGRHGRAMTLYRFGAGESCILTTAGLLSGEAYSAEAFAETDITACILPLGQFKRRLEQDAEFRALVFAEFAHRLGHIMQKIDDLTNVSVDCRLAERLLHQADEGGVITTTHDRLAADLGTAREVVSRKLALWEDRGWLVRGRGRLCLKDRRAIKHIAEK